jgi:putative PIN family toxin of toxin-antitoxin system
MRVVLDANVYVGAELSPHTLCGKVLKAFLHPQSPLELILTEKILAELIDVFLRPRIMKLIKKEEAEIRRTIGEIANLGLLVEDRPISETACRDPKDVIYLAAAETARADLIVSFDKDLLDIVEYKGIPIVKPDRFLFIANQIY